MLRAQKTSVPAPSSSASVEAAAVPAEDMTDLSSFIDDILGPPAAATAVVGDNTQSSAPPPVTEGHNNQISEEDALAAKIASLSVISIGGVNILPTVAEKYDRGAQTDDVVFAKDPTEEALMDPSPRKKRSVLQQSPLRKDSGQGPDDTPSTAEAKTEEVDAKEEEPVREFSIEEKRNIVGSDDFQSFVKRSSLIMERALGAHRVYDIMVNYSGDDGEAEGTETEVQSLSEQGMFMDERWTRGRAVTDMAWSATNPELLLVSYGRPEEDSEWFGCTEPDGVALVWSILMEKRPEFVFTCSSALLCAAFHPFDKHLLVGGTYSGQIVLWDTRSASSSPVQRSPLSSKGHTHPVYSLSIVGTPSSHSLVSASTDGRVCLWSLTQLSRPLADLQLQQVVVEGKSTAAALVSNKEVAVSAMAFPAGAQAQALHGGDEDGGGAGGGGSGEVVVGAEDGCLYSALIHANSQSGNAGTMKAVAAHHGLVTSVHFHPATGGGAALGDLLLSSSVDWSTRLWNLKESSKPLMTFEHAKDYVHSAQWSPIHPALFATADGAGQLSLWAPLTDAELPLVSKQVGERALSTVRWDHGGRRVAVGDSQGTVNVYDVAAEVATPDSDTGLRFEQLMESVVALHKHVAAGGRAAGF